MCQVNGTLIGELLLGELDGWHVGVCTLTVDENDRIVVRGENDHVVATVASDWYRLSVLPGHETEEVKDLGYIADKVNHAIRAEHAEL